uniref:G-protein coupled receptors family 1 profile domain-containing protein n=1 Tax=Pyxicephalus adspersus TaxID=30357 RepID=A0AAV3AZJ1_PYXAD|nr:TPA: hypothetical protein GDO54_005852 [Pyxicephalus adspersus]
MLIPLVYVTTIFGNLLIIGFIGTNQNLHSPMNAFLCNLAVSDIMFTTNDVPNVLAIIPEGKRMILYNSCITHLFFHGLLGCHLLKVMSYDRYLAICNPLRYARIMGVMLPRCIILVWLYSFVLIFLPIVLFPQLCFCGPNVIDHFFCDLAPLLAHVQTPLLLKQRLLYSQCM